MKKEDLMFSAKFKKKYVDINNDDDFPELGEDIAVPKKHAKPLVPPKMSKNTL